MSRLLRTLSGPSILWTKRPIRGRPWAPLGASPRTPPLTPEGHRTQVLLRGLVRRQRAGVESDVRTTLRLWALGRWRSCTDEALIGEAFAFATSCWRAHVVAVRAPEGSDDAAQRAADEERHFLGAAGGPRLRRSAKDAHTLAPEGWPLEAAETPPAWLASKPIPRFGPPRPPTWHPNWPQEVAMRRRLASFRPTPMEPYLPSRRSCAFGRGALIRAKTGDGSCPSGSSCGRGSNSCFDCVLSWRRLAGATVPHSGGVHRRNSETPRVER